MRSVLALLLLLCSGLLHAAGSTSRQPMVGTQVSPTRVTVAPGSAVSPGSAEFNDLLSRRGYTPSTTPGGVDFNELLKKPWSPRDLSDPIEVAAKRIAPWSNVARAAAKAIPAVSTAIAVKELWDAVRCAVLPTGAAGCDAGTAPVTVARYCTTQTTIPAQTPPPGTAQTGPWCGANGTELAQAYCVAVMASGRPDCTVMPSNTWGNGSVRVRYRNSNQDSFYVEGGVGYTGPTNVQSCPAYTDRNGLAHAAGEAPDADGKCDTGSYVPQTEDQIASKIEQYGNKSKAVEAVRQMDAAGIPIDLQPLAITGPAEVQGTTTTTTKPDGSTVVKTEKWPMTYTPDGYSWPPSPTIVEGPGSTVTVPPGTTTTTTTTTGSGPSGSSPNVVTCGLPGTPPCKIDETGTQMPPPYDTSGITATKDADAAKRDAAASSVVGPSWGWIPAPPQMACEPFVFPNNMGTLDPCGVVDTVRSFMAYLWVLFGVWWSFGHVRKTVTGG